MLKRLYIDNYKCYSNFELTFNALNLLMGPNGVGKSTIFEVLYKIRAFVSEGVKVTALFDAGDRTRWQISNTQKFEIELEGNGGIYKYEFALDDQPRSNNLRVQYEKLWFNAQPLLNVSLNTEQLYEAQLYRDNHSAGPLFPFDWSQSAISSIPSRHDNTKLTWFRERMEEMIIVSLGVTMMESESSQEVQYPDHAMQNFVSWFRYLYQDQGLALEIARELQEVFSGFKNFKLDKAGEHHRVLKLSFLHEGDQRKSVEYRFDELSDGQRALVALYTLLYYAKSGAYTLCIDEPENFLALQEIQPWLIQLYDSCNEGGLQALLISHHPELIDYLASSQGIWFERENNGLVRAKPITESGENGLSISELVARGWIHA